MRTCQEVLPSLHRTPEELKGGAPPAQSRRGGAAALCGQNQGNACHNTFCIQQSEHSVLGGVE